MKNAVLYLRVSTAQQAERDGDPEGYSIPAQRDACTRKADGIGATVIAEYVDRGESARSADRPGLQAMLNRVKSEADVDYVIVHKVDRLARNRADDVAINLALKAAGVRVVSVTENVDETPSGKLLYGIMSSIAEFYSDNLANEILKGSTQKAKGGGTPFLAPVGYLNVREFVNGQENRTIAIDPDRAPLVQRAFEAYATGEWSIRGLLDEMTELGLTVRATPNRPARPMAMSKFAKMLHNPYYIGKVVYRGMEYPGRHDPLISNDLFDQVQQVFSQHDKAGERQRKHLHYLKGMLFCEQCKSRMVYIEARGNGGIYPYFFCTGRARGSGCPQPYVSAEEVCAEVCRLYAGVQLDELLVEQIRTDLAAELQGEEKKEQAAARQQRARIAKLEAERRALSDRVMDGSVPPDIGREKQERIAKELRKAERLLGTLAVEYVQVKGTIDMALDLVNNCFEAYRQADTRVRREWNKSFFECFWIKGSTIRRARFTPAIASLLGQEEIVRERSDERQSKPEYRLLSLVGGDGLHMEEVLEGSSFYSFTPGSNKNRLVETGGFEPP